MKIAIVGGGPAGLYFASYLAQFNPSFDITIFEAQDLSINAFGLGYTLQKLDSILLERLDKQFYTSLFCEQATPIITEALFKTNIEKRILPFSEGFSVTRPELIRYLSQKAQSFGVSIINKKINPQMLPELQQTFDLVVISDGINSIARQQYKQEMKTVEHQAKLKFSWFTNETEHERTEACFYAFNADEGVILLTSYPLTKHKQVVIIEMTDNCLNSAELKGKTPKQAIPYLNKLLSSNGDEFHLHSTDLPWYTFKMNTAERLYHDNLVMIGDAAYSFHYSAGQGVTTSFTMAYTLSQCIQKNDNLASALAHYNHSIKLLLGEPAKKSLIHMNWFEEMDQHFNDTAPEEWLDLFLKKDEYKVATKADKACTTGRCR